MKNQNAIRYFSFVFLLPVFVFLFHPSNASAQSEEKPEAPETSTETRGKGGKAGGKGKGRSSRSTEASPALSEGFITTITRVSETGISVAAPSDSATQSSGKGKGKGKSRSSSKSSGSENVVPVSNTALITSATTARRTGDLMIGIEISGGLSNPIFENSVKARVIQKNGEVVEINIIQAEDSDKTPIAIRPKRPPMKVK